MNDDELIKRIEILEKRVDDLENTSQLPSTTTRTSVSNKKQSPKEFLLTKSVTGDVQKTLALAYYLESNEGMESFNVPDLQKTFRIAKEKLPKNLNDQINKNISRGYLMDAEEKKDSLKAWTLTSTGEKFVEEELNNNN